MSTAAIASRIAWLKTESAESIQSQQLSVIPHFAKQFNWKQIQYYIYDSERVMVEQVNTIGLKISGVKYKQILKTRVSTADPAKEVWINPIKDFKSDYKTLVDDESIQPFMLFINGRFIKWSTIKLLFSEGSTYLLVKPTNANLLKAIRVVNECYIVEMPMDLTYDEASATFAGSDFCFDSEGKVISSGAGDASIKINQTSNIDITSAAYTTINAVNMSPTSDKTNRQYTEDNIILFSSSLLDMTSTKEVVGPLITVNGGNTGSYYMYTMYNTSGDLSNDVVNKLDISELKAKVLASDTDKEKLKQQFQCTMSTQKTYSENLSDALTQVSSYDSSLLDKVYKDESNMEIVERTGKWCLDNADQNNVLYMPRRCSTSGLLDDSYCIMLINGELYTYYRLVKHLKNSVAIPLIGLNATDKIEFWWFKNVNNNSYSTIVNTADAYADVDERYLKDMLLFTKENYNTYFTFPTDGQQYFPVEYSITYDSNKKREIYLANTNLIGKTLKQVYKYRFKYATMYVSAADITDAEGANFVFNLDEPTFSTCNDYKRYLVFVNGRKIGSDQYRLTLPVRTSTPFSKFQIFFTVPLKVDDRIEVFYLPCIMNDVLTQGTMTNSGDIIVDKTNIGYNLSKDLYMVFLNGKKVPKVDISDIGAGRMRIVSDEKSLNSLCVTEVVPEDENLTSYFSANESLWEKIIAGKTSSDIYKMLGITGPTITDTEANFFVDQIPILSVMWELIRDCYMANPTVDISKSFIYDYGDVDKSLTTQSEGNDSAGNIIIDAADAARTDYLLPEGDPTIPA